MQVETFFFLSLFFFWFLRLIHRAALLNPCAVNVLARFHVRFLDLMVVPLSQSHSVLLRN